MRFRIKARDRTTGAERETTVEAPDMQGAVKACEDRGLSVLSVATMATRPAAARRGGGEPPAAVGRRVPPPAPARSDDGRKGTLGRVALVVLVIVPFLTIWLPCVTLWSGIAIPVLVGFLAVPRLRPVPRALFVVSGNRPFLSVLKLVVLVAYALGLVVLGLTGLEMQANDRRCRQAQQDANRRVSELVEDARGELRAGKILGAVDLIEQALLVKGATNSETASALKESIDRAGDSDFIFAAMMDLSEDDLHRFATEGSSPQ